MPKKVLVITYHWPPSGGVTVLRCLKIAKYLRGFGWEPIIVTAKNAHYPFIDKSNEKDILDGIEIHRIPIWEPINLFKLFSGRKKNEPLQNITSSKSSKRSWRDQLGIWIRGNYFIPDARCMWIKPCLVYLEAYLRKHHIDAIFTDGPPHTNTVIGLRLKQKFGIPWLADFQDPWTQVDYFKDLSIGYKANKKHIELEQAVFKNADKITIASPSWAKDLESIGATNVSVLFYGYDESDFLNFKKNDASKFVIFHGGMLGEDRNPKVFFYVLSKLISENKELGSRIELRLAGEVDFSVKKTITNYNLDSVTSYLGMISRDKVILEYAKSSLLLLPINKAKNAKGRIPGKLFELLRSDKPILVLGPDDGDVKSIVTSKQKGTSIEYENYQSIFSFLYKAILNNDFGNFNSSTTVKEFSNYNVTKKVVEYLNSMIKSDENNK